ncbi:ATP-binding protein [Phytohabitans suffuscus]|uniref:ATP-binding protein n=1 Tax=Phytohabitans suffuscus TaxID=624315 RepID=UPI001563DBAA|nr:tetratricopeptide repeat protein [Phytohabitans suffuscus]
MLIAVLVNMITAGWSLPTFLALLALVAIGVAGGAWREAERARQSRSSAAQPAALPAEASQLPPDIVHFTGREDELARVRRMVHRAGRVRPTSVLVSTLSGKGGVGKTALALRIAHDLLPSFPDAQLYVDLRGVGGEPLAPADVLAGFLRALGVDEDAVPAGLTERQNLFRARLAGRRALVLLDNAASEAQVRPLLPGGPTCVVLVTSRRTLAALEADESFMIDLLSPADALALLTKIVGAARVDAEPAVAAEVVRLCDHLPLAVRIAGARLVARPHWMLADLAGRLRDEHRRLDELVAGDLAVRATFHLGYRGQGSAHREAFRLLGLLRSTDFPAWAAAAVLDVPVTDGEEILEDLCEARLVEIGGRTRSGTIRYRFHDLLRDFARERALSTDEPAVRTEAVARVLGGYLALAEAADTLLEPGLRNLGDGPAVRWRAGDEAFVGRNLAGDPHGWFMSERAALEAAVEVAWEYRLFELTWELAGIFAAFFAVRIYPKEWEKTHLLALKATNASNDLRGEAFIRRSLGRLYRYTGRWAEATASYEMALAIFQRTGETLWEGVTFRNLGDLFRDLDDLALAERNLNLCLDVFRRIGDRQWEAAGLISLGETLVKQGRAAEAGDCFERCLPIFKAGGHQWWQAVALVALGEARLGEDRLDASLAHLLAGLEIFTELDDQRRMSLTKVTLGTVYARRGRFREAADHLEGCLATFQRLGDRLWEARALEALAGVYEMRKMHVRAGELRREAAGVIDGIRPPASAAPSPLET